MSLGIDDLFRKVLQAILMIDSFLRSLRIILATYYD